MTINTYSISASSRWLLTSTYKELVILSLITFVFIENIKISNYPSFYEGGNSTTCCGVIIILWSIYINFFNRSISLFNKIINLINNYSKEINNLFNYTLDLIYVISKVINNLFNYTIVLMKKHSKKFIAYLAGLIEGDGSIFLLTRPKKNPNKKSNKKSDKDPDKKSDKLFPRLSITFNIKELPLALYLQKELGMGKVYDHSKLKNPTNSCHLVIHKQKELIDLLILLNGQFKTRKINSLRIAYNWLNENVEDFNLECLPVNTTPIGDDPWLAGFTDADGSFGLYKDKNGKISSSYHLCQKYIPGDETEKIMIEIAHFINERLPTHRVRHTGSKTNENLTIISTSINSNLRVINYFNKFPLLSSKGLDFKDWEKFYLLQHVYNDKTISRAENRIQKVQLLELLKSQMNNKRVFFNWDHLKDNIYIKKKK